MRKALRETVRLIERAGIPVDRVEVGRKHTRITLGTPNGPTLFVSKTGSDWRGNLNAVRDARKLYRDFQSRPGGNPEPSP